MAGQFIRLGVLVALLGLAACATRPQPPPTPSEALRASLGTVGVVSVGPALGAKVMGPIGVGNEVGKGALKGAGIGGASGAGLGALIGLACGPFAPACVPLFAGAGLLGGAVVGGGTGAIINGANAIPTGTATNIEAALRVGISDRDLQADLRQHVLDRATAGSARNTMDLGMSQAGDPSAAPDYAQFAASGVHTVLEVGIAQIALTGDRGSNPVLVLSINARARLIRVSDNQVLWNDEQMAVKSQAADISVWTASDSGLLKSELDRGLETLAREIGVKVFSAAGAIKTALHKEAFAQGLHLVGRNSV